MHARADTYHSRPVYQRSLICTQVHDRVRKIEIARYCRHEGIPWVIYRTLWWDVKTQWELIELQWDLERKLQKKKDFLKIKVKSVEIFKERHWEIERFLLSKKMWNENHYLAELLKRIKCKFQPIFENLHWFFDFSQRNKFLFRSFYKKISMFRKMSVYLTL